MANDKVVSKKTFGNHSLVIPGREPSLKTNGGLMYYHYDGMRNVTELTDRNGDSIEQYRYDAFGGLYTGVTAPYNTYTLAGKSYDPKANLIDMHARWYQAQNGRFTTADPYRGEALTPYTQNRYAYVGNNPINRWDPLGYWMAGDENLSDDAFDRIGELTEQWEKAATKEEKDRIHQEADRVREQDRNGSSGGSSGGSGGSSDDDDDDESYERPMRAIDWYYINQAILNGYGSVSESSVQGEPTFTGSFGFGTGVAASGTYMLLENFSGGSINIPTYTTQLGNSIGDLSSKSIEDIYKLDESLMKNQPMRISAWETSDK